MRRDIEGSAVMKLPNEMVPHLLDEMRNTDILGSLLLWMELLPSASFQQSSQFRRHFDTGVIRPLEVKE